MRQVEQNCRQTYVRISAPSNLRQKHLRMQAFNYVSPPPATLQEVGNTIRFAIVENPVMHANFVVVCFIERELLPIQVLHAFSTFLAPVTMTLTQ